jgi:hypothetical protein
VSSWAFFLAYFPYFKKTRKYAYAISLLSVNHFPSILEWMDPSLWNLVCISRHLSPSQRRTSWFPPISLFLYVYPPFVARQHLGKNVTARTNIHAKIEQLVGASFLYGPCLTKRSRRLILPRTSYLGKKIYIYVILRKQWWKWNGKYCRENRIGYQVKIKLSLCLTN